MEYTKRKMLEAKGVLRRASDTFIAHPTEKNLNALTEAARVYQSAVARNNLGM